MGHGARHPGAGRLAVDVQVRALRVHRRLDRRAPVRGVEVGTVVPLDALQLVKQVDRTATPLPAVITAGTTIPYQFTVTNAGLETCQNLTIVDDHIRRDRSRATARP